MSEPLYRVVVLSRRGRVKRRYPKQPEVMARIFAEELRSKLAGQKMRVQVRRDRSPYWAARHKDKYQNDPAYRERLIRYAKRWQHRVRAEARGDITPWLEPQR